MTLLLQLLLAAGLVLIDQAVKQLVLTYLAPIGRTPIIENVLYLLYHENTGAAFGILQNNTLVLGILSAVISAGIIWMLAKKQVPGKYLPWCAAVALGGALGNMIDRLLRGFVVDYIYFSPINFPVFNFADICLTCSLFAIIIDVLFIEKGLA